LGQNCAYQRWMKMSGVSHSLLVWCLGTGQFYFFPPTFNFNMYY
jgi:hypothetical protein